MKIMVISDPHYDKKFYRGVDQSKAWEWLLSIVDYHRPDLLISLGDWGGAVNESNSPSYLEGPGSDRYTAIMTDYKFSEKCLTRLLINLSLCLWSMVR